MMVKSARSEAFRDCGREQLDQARLDIIFGGKRFDEQYSILDESHCGDEPGGCKFFANDKKI